MIGPGFAARGAIYMLWPAMLIVAALIGGSFFVGLFAGTLLSW